MALNEEKVEKNIVVKIAIMKEKMLRREATNEIEAKITRLLSEPTGLTDLITDHCLLHDAYLKKDVG